MRTERDKEGNFPIGVQLWKWAQKIYASILAYECQMKLFVIPEENSKQLNEEKQQNYEKE